MIIGRTTRKTNNVVVSSQKRSWSCPFGEKGGGLVGREAILVQLLLVNKVQMAR